MSIHEELRAELKDALRTRNQEKADVVRQIETEVSVAKTAADFSGEVDDALYARVIAAYSKKMAKAVEEYKGLGERGAEMVEKLSFEVEFLSRWLPKTLSEEQTRALVQKTIAELGVSGPQAIGRVMGQIMKLGVDGLDGKLVNKLVREALS